MIKYVLKRFWCELLFETRLYHVVIKMIWNTKVYLLQNEGGFSKTRVDLHCISEWNTKQWNWARNFIGTWNGVYLGQRKKRGISQQTNNKVTDQHSYLHRADQQESPTKNRSKAEQQFQSWLCRCRRRAHFCLYHPQSHSVSHILPLCVHIETSTLGTRDSLWSAAYLLLAMAPQRPWEYTYTAF